MSDHLYPKTEHIAELTRSIGESKLLSQRMRDCNVSLRATAIIAIGRLYDARELQQELNELHEVAKSREQRGEL